MNVKSVILSFLLFFTFFAPCSLGYELLLDRDAVVEKAKGIRKADYPNAHTVLVDDYQRVEYNRDGTYINDDDYYVKVLTEKGRRESSVFKGYYNRALSKLNIDAIEVIKPNGRILPVKIEKNIKDQVNPSQMSSNIYDPNSRLVTVNIPGLEVGDLIHYRLSLECFHTRIANNFCDLCLFQEFKPTLHYRYEVIGPTELPLRKMMVKGRDRDKVSHTVVKKEGKIYYTWVAEDMPQLIEEPKMPSVVRVGTRVLVSTFSDWPAVSQWYYHLSEPHIVPSLEMKEKVRELTAGCGERAEKIDKIFHWVSQKVRYMGITTEKEAPGYEPHDITQTFARGYGVCRDKAALLAGMFRLIGEEAYPVLIYVGTKRDEEVPLPYFNHAITAIRESDSSYTLYDATSETAKEYLPDWERDCSYLVSSKYGEPLKTTPVRPAKENLLKTETTIRFVGGKAKGETEVLFTGLWDEVYRGYFIRQSPKDIEDYINRMVKKWSSTAEVDTFQLLPKDLVNQMGQHLQLVLRFTWEEPLIGNGKYAMLPLHYLSTDFGLMRYILGEMALRRRNFNFRTRFTISSEDRVRMEFDEDYKEIVLPKNEPVEKVGYSLRFDFQKPSRRAVEIRRSFALNRVEFTPAEYLQLKGCTEQQEIADKKAIILKRRGVPKGSSNVEGCHHGVCPVGGELNSLRSPSSP